MYESKTLAPDCCTCSQIVRLIDGRLNYLCISVHIIMKQLKTSSPVSTWIDDTLSGVFHSLPSLSLSLFLSLSLSLSGKLYRPKSNCSFN